ncbi:MAG: hypothetical protein M1479_10020 [Actinobacteria bacterium]|nr:hypothetical protein [Actinomycetota bacterium]
MTKKIILGIFIAILVSFMATGFLYANSKDINFNGSSNHNTDKEKIFHITSSANYGGSIYPKINQSVDEGDDFTFTIEIKDGYRLEWLRVDNIKYKNYSSNSYTFMDVNKNHTIQVHFKKIKS